METVAEPENTFYFWQMKMFTEGDLHQAGQTALQDAKLWQ